MFEEVIGLLFNPYIQKKKLFLDTIEEKEEISKFFKETQFTPELFYSINNSENRFFYLKNLHEFGNKKTSMSAMKIMEENLHETKKIEDIQSKVILIKYIAIHSDKEVSKRAIELLFSFIEEIPKIENDELKASCLRYLYLHSNKKRKLKILKKIEEITDDYIKENSMDYLRKYS